MSRLASHVVVRDDNDEAHTFGPDDEVPGWAVTRITNAKAWEGGEVPTTASSSTDGPPPKAGRGSSEDAWRSYAAANDVDVSGAEGRDDIVAACEAAGVPVE